MKKTTSLIALLAILVSSFNAFAEGEDDDERRRRRKGGSFGLHLNVAPMANGVFSLNGELGLSKNLSLVATAGYMRFPITYTSSNGVEVNHFSGFMLAPEVRYYIDPSRRPGLDGWFVGGYAKVRSMATGPEDLIRFPTFDPFNPNPSTDEVRYGASWFGISAGATVGYMYQFKNGLTFGAWTGFGYFFVKNVEYTIDNPDTFVVAAAELMSVDPRSGVTIGYRF